MKDEEMEKIRAGDVVVFERMGCKMHGRVSAKGWIFITSPFVPQEEPILFVHVIEHPEWKNTVLQAWEILSVLILAEKVHFT